MLKHNCMWVQVNRHKLFVLNVWSVLSKNLVLYSLHSIKFIQPHSSIIHWMTNHFLKYVKTQHKKNESKHEGRVNERTKKIHSSWSKITFCITWLEIDSFDTRQKSIHCVLQRRRHRRLHFQQSNESIDLYTNVLSKIINFQQNIFVVQVQMCGASATHRRHRFYRSMPLQLKFINQKQSRELIYNFSLHDLRQKRRKFRRYYVLLKNICNLQF